MKIPIIDFFGIPIANVSKTDVLTIIDDTITSSKKRSLFFVNANNFIHAYNNDRYKQILQTAGYVFGDGIGIKYAALLGSQKLIDNVNGTDVFPLLCKHSSVKKYTLYFLGGKPAIVKNVLKNIQQQYPELTIVGMHHGYFDAAENEKIITQINSVSPNILLIGFGTPIQEEWIYNHAGELDCNVIIGVGGLFDYYSGNIKRAPIIFRRLGLEWFFRLLQEPRRLWKRYLLGAPKFMFIVLKQILSR